MVTVMLSSTELLSSLPAASLLSLTFTMTL